MRAWQIPLRLATGAFILNSGLDKRRADAQTAERLQDFAAGGFPAVKRLEPQQFAQVLSTAEIALGAALLSPFVSSTKAGLALGGYSGSLLNLYWKTPGAHRDGDPRPTPDGIVHAKDVWMAGAAVSLLLGVFDGTGRRRRKQAKAKTKAKAKAKATAARQATAAKLAHRAAPPAPRRRRHAA
jgi:hypothetical protein